ncbi:hypothetical protein OCO_10610 [Mycobacterium intracellulare MOTT-02]|nr:hypothetical protein OCO_10610 [Mycobacterium intracellulare MOTT-02]
MDNRHRRDEDNEENDPGRCRAHSEPLGEQQGASDVERNEDGKHQTDGVLVVHSRSTSF